MIEALNCDLEHEMAAIIRYLHHSFLVKGPLRGPLSTLFRTKALESMAHAITLGEKITVMGGHPSVSIQQVFNCTQEPTIEGMIKENLEAEEHHLALYEEQLSLVKGNTALRLMIEQFIVEEASHIEELQMYIRHTVREPIEV